MPYKDKSIALTHASWRSMNYRCSNKSHENYKKYGGNGIKVCERWSSFKCFLNDMGIRPIGTVIDRIDNGKGYSKSNCRWATYKESTANRKNTVFIGGERVSDMAHRLGLKPWKIYQKIAAGWSKSKIESLPWPARRNLFQSKLSESDVKRIRFWYGTEPVSMRELAKQYGMDKHSISLVIKRKTYKYVQ